METDVVVIGGGAAGLGVAWDLTLHGLRVTLVEMGDVGTGTSSRDHGRLHTGSRYAASDLKSAKKCWQEHTTILCSPPRFGRPDPGLRPPKAQTLPEMPDRQVAE
jgi:glycerol-3-phosphate dehydrogenase